MKIYLNYNRTDCLGKCLDQLRGVIKYFDMGQGKMVSMNQSVL
jgi:hypothetical protein